MSWTVGYLVFSVLSLSVPGSVIIASGQIQMAAVERGGDGQCPSVEEGERARNEINQFVNSVIANTFPTTTPASTTTMPSTTASATITPTTDSTITMSTITDCGGPGWRRVAFINMTDTSYNCPTGLNLTSYSKRTCGRSQNTTAECSSTTFSVDSLPYSHVCGRIRGYQVGSATAFFKYATQSNSYYVRLTHGGAGNQQHIWTFVAGLSEVTARLPSLGCPCDTAPQSIVPASVGNDYFCESGLHSEWDASYDGVLFADDVLWDGQNCTSTSTCCQFNNPPWFTKNLPTATTDDIGLRLCIRNPPSLSDILLELIELYVQ